MMRPVFCGNFEYETRHSDLERLFSRYGRIDRIDMKSGAVNESELYPGSLSMQTSLAKGNLPAGFAFVYFEDERDAEDAIRSLDNASFGHSKRRLSVEWSRGERGRYRDSSRGMANTRPTKTLFVINFDPIRTRTRDVERHFEPYGKVLNVRIRRNFAFVQFDSQDEATKALECTNMSKLLDRVVSVEYAHRDDGEKGDGFESPRRGYGGRAEPYDRSVSPVRRSRPSPDYVASYNRSVSPVRRSRPSPDYGRRPRSPVYDHFNGPISSPAPDYHQYRSPSPVRRSRT